MSRRELTHRERVLAAICIGAAAIMIVRFGVIEPMGGIKGGLTREIRDSEDTLAILTEASRLVEWVDQDYRRYSSMMSDERSDEEVRNNLQEEIFNLAKKAAISVSTIKQGSMEVHTYYKRYLVTFHIEGAPARIANFLKYLEDSPKLLHVEKLDLDRSSDLRLKGQLTVSRSLVASAEHDVPKTNQPADATQQTVASPATFQKPNLIVNGGFESWDKGYVKQLPNGWKRWGTYSSADQKHKAEGNFAAQITAIKSGGNFMQELVLKAGTTYTWSAQASVVNGTASIYAIDVTGRTARVHDEMGKLTVSSKDMKYYEQRFTVGGTPGQQRRVRIQVSLSKPGAVLYLDNVTLYEGADY